MIFAFDELARFFEKLRAMGPVHRLCDWQGEHGTVLRHDIDFDLRPALRLAEFEAENHILSTFLVMVSNPFYNIFAPQSRATLRAISDMGFDVGVHFDPTVYDDAPDGELQARLDEEARAIGDIIGKDVRSVSLHQPTLLGRFPLFDGYCNAYDPSIFGPDRYLSDSNRVFRHDPMAFIEKAADGAIQVLLHPFHYSPDGAPYTGIIAERLEHFCDDISGYFSVNKTFTSEFPDGVAHGLASKGGPGGPRTD